MLIVLEKYFFQHHEKESKSRVMTSLRDSKENVFEIGKITKKNGNETQIQIL